MHSTAERKVQGEGQQRAAIESGMARKLEQTLQALYDSQINVTITWLCDGGIDFALRPLVNLPDINDFYHVNTVAELADALHEQALRDYPESEYATGRVSELETLTGISPECQRGECGACPWYHTSTAG